MQMVYLELAKSDDWSRRADGTKTRLADGQWTDQKFEWTRSQSHHCHLEEHESRGKESPRKTSTNSKPLMDAQVATQSKITNGRKPKKIVAGCELKNLSEKLHKEQKDWIEEMN